MIGDSNLISNPLKSEHDCSGTESEVKLQEEIDDHFQNWLNQPETLEMVNSTLRMASCGQETLALGQAESEENTLEDWLKRCHREERPKTGQEDLQYFNEGGIKKEKLDNEPENIRDEGRLNPLAPSPLNYIRSTSGSPVKISRLQFRDDGSPDSCKSNEKSSNSITESPEFCETPSRYFTPASSPLNTSFGFNLFPEASPFLSPRVSVSPPRGYEIIPRFFWAQGKPPAIHNLYETMMKVQEESLNYEGSTFQEFGVLVQAIGTPLYWKKPLWIAIDFPQDKFDSRLFLEFFRKLTFDYPEPEAKFIRILSKAAQVLNSKQKGKRSFELGPPNALIMSDFEPLVQDIVDNHPGLKFLQEVKEFHTRYIITVISRIFYRVNRSWSGQITAQELQKSNFLQVVRNLEEMKDINREKFYFSYEAFYVIYCKFWELDKDHNLLIDKNDLSAHADHALSSRIIDRIFSGTVMRGWDLSKRPKCSSDEGKMTYSDFVWFLLSEEDKKSPTAIEYWFRCLDLDGDGILSIYELEYFYSDQASRIQSIGVEPLSFSNIYCQIVDMLGSSPTGILLKDLKANPTLASNVFNTLFNLDKYLSYEQMDPPPFILPGDADGIKREKETDWDKYYKLEYDQLVADESPGSGTSGEPSPLIQDN